MMRGALILGLAMAVLAACGKGDDKLSTSLDTEAGFAVPAPIPTPIPARIDHGPGVYEPAQGDPERKALLDAIRPKVVVDLGVPVEFKVTTLRISGDWAFAELEPVKTGGAGPLAIADTKLKDEEGERDGLRTEVIWRKKNAGWEVDQYGVGATDVWYEPYCDTAPKSLIPICANRQPKP